MTDPARTATSPQRLRLRAAPAGLNGIDADYEFEERAAIREYDGGLPRAAAERLARLDMLVADRDQAKAA